MKREFKLLRVTFALALGAGALSVVAASPAGAATANSCAKLSGTATFSPGVTTASRNQVIKSKGTATGCKPSKSTGGSGVVTATIKSPAANCTKLVKGGQTLKGTAQTVWKNKKVTKFNISLKTGTGGNATLATITGKVTSGLFAGKTVTGQVRFKLKAGQNCTTVPVKNLTFTSTKPFALH